MTRVDGIKRRYESGTWYPASHWREDIGVLLNALAEMTARERATYMSLQEQRQRARRAEDKAGEIKAALDDLDEFCPNYTDEDVITCGWKSTVLRLRKFMEEEGDG